MAPKKRQRSVIDNGDTEVIEVESAQSSLQQTSVGSLFALLQKVEGAEV